MRILSVVSIKAYSRYGYDYLSKIVLRRADFQEHKIAKKDFKNLYPSDFEDLNLLLLQGHLDHLPGFDKCMLSTAVKLWIRQRHDYTIIESPREVVFPVNNNERKIMKFKEIYKFSDGTLTRILEALDYRVKEFKIKRLNPGNSDVYSLEDPTLLLEILSRRFFLRLNLPDHKSVLTGSGGSSKDGDGDTSFQWTVWYTVLAVCQGSILFWRFVRVVHCASGLSFPTAVYLIRQRFISSGLSFSVVVCLTSRGKRSWRVHTSAIDEGPFKMGRCRDEIATGTDGPYLGPERDRVVADLSQAEKDRLRADIRATNILLQGSELTKDDRESQLYDEFKHFGQHKGENIHDCYVRGLKESNHDQLYAYLKQHELHANENKMLMERLNQHTHDLLALVSNVSSYQYPSSSSVPPQPSYTLPVTYQPQFIDNTQLDTGFSPTDELLDNLTKQVAFLAQQYKTQFPQTNNQLRTSSNTRNQATVQNGRVVEMGRGAQYRAGIANAGQGKPIKYYNYNGMGHIARNCTQPKRPRNSDYFKEKMLLMQAQENGVDLDAEQLLFLAGGQTNTFDDEVDEGPVQDMAQNEDNIFQADQCDAFDSDVDEAPTTHTMFMANLSSADPVYDETGPSYDFDTLSEVQDHDNCLDNLNKSHEEHEMHNVVQQNDVVDSDTEYMSNSNIISYEQYLQDNEDQVVHSDVSSVPNDAIMIITNDIYE
ncbi:hypothetical protein Tco_1484941 [Tanacetum coccineum]